MDVNLDAKLYAYQLAIYFRCPRQRIQWWVSQGHLPVHERDRHDRPKYLLRAALEAERVTGNDPNSRRPAIA